MEYRKYLIGIANKCRKQAQRHYLYPFIIIPIWYILKHLNSYYNLEIDFLQVTVGEFIVGFGTILLSLYTYHLAQVTVSEGRRNRELQTLDIDLKEIYSPLCNLLNSRFQEEGYIVLFQDGISKLHVIFNWEYRMDNDVLKAWEEQTKDPNFVKTDESGTTYHIGDKFSKLIEEKYQIKRKRFQFLSSS